MAETITEFQRRNIGSMRQTRGRFTSSGTEVDVVTGLTRVVFAALQGVDTVDNQVSIARNSSTTTDESRNAMGQIHCESVDASNIYQFIAEGY